MYVLVITIAHIISGAHQVNSFILKTNISSFVDLLADRDQNGEHLVDYSRSEHCESYISHIVEQTNIFLLFITLFESHRILQ